MSDRDDIEHTELDEMIRKADGRYSAARIARLEDLYRAIDAPKAAQLTCIECGHPAHEAPCATWRLCPECNGDGTVAPDPGTLTRPWCTGCVGKGVVP